MRAFRVVGGEVIAGAPGSDHARHQRECSVLMSDVNARGRDGGSAIYFIKNIPNSIYLEYFEYFCCVISNKSDYG